MKRPPGIWMLLSAGVLWLSLQDVYGIRATALIFAKSTTTTTPAPVPNATDSLQSDTEVVTESSTNTGNVTKPPLTGNPQIDYIYDPNLPKELNGYNLSSYPFYERVPDPDEIDFKCDGLHDGFYASIAYKCQVYHHCLFGTRYDFLCANYTAFDQKTFICQFVSDVDCVGSKKFWHRNDALYKATTTTTPKPLNIYTTAPPPPEQPPKGRGGGGGGGKRRRPIQRRPQFDYYEYDDEYDDEYYDDRPRSRRRRPRPRPRPIYDDEYDDEYEDESYERRNRRPYNRRGGGGAGADRRRNKNRNKNHDVEDEERPTRKKNDEETTKRKNEDKKEKNRDEFEDYDARPTRPRKGQRRPIEDDYEDRKIEENEEKSLVKPTTGTIYDRPRVAPRIKPPVPKNEANKYAYKPVTKTTTTSTVEDDYYEDYDELKKNKNKNEEEIKPKPSENKERKTNARPIKTKLDDDDDELTLTQKFKGRNNKGRNRNRTRVEQSKTTTTTTTTTTESSEIKQLDEEYYDYEIEKMPSSTETTRKKTTQKPRTTTTTTTAKTTTTTVKTTTPIQKEQVVKRIVKRPFLPSRGGNPYSSRGLQPVGLKAEVMEQQSTLKTSSRQNSRPKDYEYDDIEYEPQTRTAGTRQAVGHDQDHRLASAARPNFEPQTNDHREVSARPNFEPSNDDSVYEPQLRPSNTRQKFVETKSKVKFSDPITDDNEDEFKPIKRPYHISRPSYDTPTAYNGPRTTQKPKILTEQNPLDINNEHEYDVTLNDALNPTLPNLPSNTNFGNNNGYNAAQDYTFSAFQQRPPYAQPAPVSNRQRYEAVYNTRDQYVAPSSDYKYFNGAGVGSRRGGAVATASSYYTTSF